MAEVSDASAQDATSLGTAKLAKAGFRSNNSVRTVRYCMASAVQGFMRTFGMDEPIGRHDDIEAADDFVLWGSNMAEMLRWRGPASGRALSQAI